MAITQVVMANSITSLRAVGRMEWRTFVEAESRIELVLRKDPSGFYGGMTFATRDRYRHSVERIAKRTRLSEEAVAEKTIECARSGLFDVLAHPDLVKVWGRARPLPDRDLRAFYEPAVEAIAESGIAVEISTAGLRKPVGELYPSREFAEMCVEAGAPFALSSDAHLPEHVGFEYDRAVDFLGELGIDEICVFEQRRRSTAPLGSRVG